jgi:Xaa-Pro aminopeptidase
MIDATHTRARRQAVLKHLQGHPLLFRAAPVVLRNGDVHFSYRQDSSFHYLTGFDEPEAILLAVPEGKDKHKTILFVRPRDPAREIWDGKRAGTTGAKRQYGADEAYPLDDFWRVFADLSKDWDGLAHALSIDTTFDAKLLDHFGRRYKDRPRRNQGLPTLLDPRPAIHAKRLIKTPEEIDLMAEAARITGEGHRVAMALARPGMMEYELQAELEAVFRKNGSPRVGYDSIVATGANACTLHYIENNKKIRKGDLVLIDAGAEFRHYTADVTRTFPAGGAFSAPQKAIYEIVLRCQKKCIKAIKPGLPVSKLIELSQKEILKGLDKLGLLGRGSLESKWKKRAFAKYYMHGLGHWLGMDVHDCGAYQLPDGKPIKMAAGMVTTVEPGIYIPANDKSVPKEFRGIGVRIEDDILVTRNGNRNLTEDIPKEIADVEAFTQG